MQIGMAAYIFLIRNCHLLLRFPPLLCFCFHSRVLSRPIDNKTADDEGNGWISSYTETGQLNRN